MRIVGATDSTVLMVTHDVDEAILLSDRVVMMTNGPAAKIGAILPVDLPRPRERLALASNRRYLELRQEALEFLHRRHLKEAA
jgi:nitrate/nitrite transport system ATP-binding protein